jgi:hypothetical protein
MTLRYSQPAVFAVFATFRTPRSISDHGKWTKRKEACDIFLTAFTGVAWSRVVHALLCRMPLSWLSLHLDGWVCL